MKHCLLLLLLLCVNVSFSQALSKRKIKKHLAAVAQSKRKGTVILSLDTIYNKGVPYAILREYRRLPYIDYKLFSLSNEKLAVIISATGADGMQTPYYSFQFVGTGRIAEPEKRYGSRLAKSIVEHQLVNGDKIDPFEEVRFLKKYPRRYSNPHYVAYIEDKDQTQMVERNRNKDVYARNGEILQDGQIIGHYKDKGGLLRFYLPGGYMVAEARAGKEANTWLMTSLKDHKDHSLEAASGKEVMSLIYFLVDNSYL